MTCAENCNCPECNGYNESIRKDIATKATLLAAIDRLRYRWSYDAGGTMYTNCCQAWIPCSTNAADRPTCRPDCWLAELLK